MIPLFSADDEIKLPYME